MNKKISLKKQPKRASDGLLFGVAKGLADYFNLNVFWVRLFIVAATLITGFFPILIIYIVAIFLMPKNTTKSTLVFKPLQNSYQQSPKDIITNLRLKTQKLEQRLQYLENHITSKEFDWEKRFYK